MKKNDVVMDKAGNVYLVDMVGSKAIPYFDMDTGKKGRGKLVFVSDAPDAVYGGFIIDKNLTKIG